MNISVNIINSFSIDGIGGNPAGVVLDADNLSSIQKQEIARKAGLSETAFVSKSSVADFKLEFFTPTKQIPHCGHATIATFWYLKSLGKIHSTNSSKETIDGIRKIYFHSDEPFMEQPSARFTEIADSKQILRSIGLAKTDLIMNHPPIIGNTGNSFILIGVDKQDKLGLMQPNFSEIRKITELTGCVGYYVYAITHSAFNAETRMFAPSYGIDEESATGMAAGPLACLLYTSGMVRKSEVNIGQGKFMRPSSPSRIKVDLQFEGSEIKTLKAGGKAYLASTRSIEI